MAQQGGAAGGKDMALIPFDDRDGSIWMNGELVPWRDAKLFISLAAGLPLGVNEQSLTPPEDGSDRHSHQKTL